MRDSHSSALSSPLVTPPTSHLPPRTTLRYANLSVKEKNSFLFGLFTCSNAIIWFKDGEGTEHYNYLVDWQGLVVVKMMMFILEGLHLLLVMMMVNIVVSTTCGQSGFVSLV